MKNYYILSLAALVSVLASACKPAAVEEPQPKADFTVTGELVARKTLIFKDNSQNASTYHWDFGDGTTSEDKIVAHVYSHQALFRVKLTVSNSAGSSTKEQLFEVLSYVAPAPPVANFTVGASRLATEAITFTNASTQDSTRFWVFGDGSTSTERSPSHIYTTAGTYIVNLCVSNPLGSHCKSDTIVVSPYIPFNLFAGNYSMYGKCHHSITTSTSYTADSTIYNNSTWTVTRVNGTNGTDNLLLNGNTYKYIGGSFDFKEKLGAPLNLKFRNDSLYYDYTYVVTSGSFASHTVDATRCNCKGKKQ
jgi:PKD repeat protein